MITLEADKAEQRLSSPDNLALRFGRAEASEVKTTVLRNPGRAPGSKNLLGATRDSIALRARLGEGQNQLAVEYGTSQSTISDIESGDTKGVDEKKVTSALDKIRDVALDKLMNTLGLMSEDKLSALNAKDLSSVAANMSKVVGQTIPQAGNNGPAVAIHIYAPEVKTERSFKIVEI